MSPALDRPVRRALGSCISAYLVFGVAAAILIAFRLQAFELPLETDECNYAYIGKRLLLGDRLYVDVWDHQPFGVFILFASVIGVVGDAPQMFRWLATASCLVSLALVMGILRSLGGNRGAVVGGLLYAIVSSDPGTGGEGCNREIYMNAMILAAWYSILAGRSRGRATFTAGLLLGLASTFKTIVAVHWVALGLYLVCFGNGPDPGTHDSRQVWRRLTLFAAGPVLIWTASLGYFTATGRFSEFIDAVFWFNMGYAESDEPFWMRFFRFFAPLGHRFIFESAFSLWLLAAAAGVALAVKLARRRDRESAFVLSLLLSGYFATCLPGRFWPHYYYLLIPACVIAAAYFIETAINSFTRPLGLKSRGKRLLAYALCAVLWLTLLYSEGRHYLLEPDFGKTAKRYNSRDFWGRAHGENVASVTGPEDSIFVFGNEASIYYYAHRRCASRYTMITGLAEGMSGTQERRQTLLDELRAAPPRLILVLFDEKPFEEWKAFLHEQYGEPAGWDFGDATREPIMFVLAHKDRPIRPINWDWDRTAVGGWKLKVPR